MSTLRLTTAVRSAPSTSLRAGLAAPVSIPISVSATRLLHQTQSPHQDGPPSAVPDGLAEGSVKGRTGGGEKLESSSKNAPPKPKITNASVPGTTQTETLTEEQKKEVEEHNRDFEAKHDHGSRAPDDKVDKKFWTGGSEGGVA